MLLIGELLKQCERYLAEGLHPRVLVEGFEVAKKAALEFLEEFKTPMDAAVGNTDREMVRMVARTSLVSCPCPALSVTSPPSPAPAQSQASHALARCARSPFRHPLRHPPTIRGPFRKSVPRHTFRHSF